MKKCLYKLGQQLTQFGKRYREIMLGPGLINISTLLESYANINLHARKTASERIVSFSLRGNKAWVEKNVSREITSASRVKYRAEF